MSGITHVLNIAKQALLTHQMSIQVTGHNVANVDTPGYTRQSLSLKANEAIPVGTGLLGGGVMGDTITRNYDQFMVERIARQSSLMGNLEAQQQALRVVEPIFNEARGLALNDLLNQFWNSWQELSDNPETLASRQNVLQHGQLLVDHLGIMNGEIIRARSDIGVSLKAGINDVNSLTTQIAELNAKISTAEVARGQANDLRDRRDNLVKELSSLLDISQFADKNGSYTILLANGHPLVEGQESWRVDWVDDQLNWLSKDANGRTISRPLGTGAHLGGKVGGWLEIHSELTAGNPNNYAGRLEALANALVRELNQVHADGIGTIRFSEPLVGGELGAMTSVTTGRIDAGTAHRTIPAGTITINGLSIGEIRGGSVMEKAANTVNAINQADSGVIAGLTTQVTGAPVDAAGLTVADTISFTVNGVEVNYTVQAGDPGDNAAFAANLAAAANGAIQAHNGDADNLPPKVTIEALVGDGGNGAATNALIFRNTNAGDQSSITIDNLAGDFADPGLSPAILGLAAVAGETLTADAGHNTGQITLFSDQPYTIQAGVDDTFLTQLGLHNIDTETPGNGRLTITPGEGPNDAFLLAGYKHSQELNTENGSFSIWLYNDDGSLALPQPVEVSLERAYSVHDAVNAINNAIINAGGTDNPLAASPLPWVQASFTDHRLKLTPTGGHQFAFTADSSNLLQVTGLNTFFTGHSAGTIGINQTIIKDLNHLAAGQVGPNGEIYPGDNTNALAISGLQHKDDIEFLGGKRNSLNEFYNSLVGDIGNRSRTVKRNVEFNSLVLNQMNEMRDTISGVSLDEEMANLIKFQHAYTAAARLISKSDEMLVTLLDTVR
ncbi:flagellar hook-associated protein FlgK [Desulfurivibrio sp. D14AmB]|uniref:flagellar hook-associated protein FlgK n=1 Tax=Desulfurivibrio sp. D14AmB TaxID=3374370 RepID=UPI00376EAB7F